MRSRVAAGPIPALCRRYGGIDFGFRNPCAAVWGGLDKGGVLWLTDEHYVREVTPGDNAACLPKEVCWYADPAGAGDIAVFRRAGLTVHKGRNAVRNGVSAVQARIRLGLLRIAPGACANLLHEASLYCWPDVAEGQRSEQPASGYDHVLDALRYLISRLDEHRTPGQPPRPDVDPEPSAPGPRVLRWKDLEPWKSLDNPDIWTVIR